MQGLSFIAAKAQSVCTDHVAGLILPEATLLPFAPLPSMEKPARASLPIPTSWSVQGLLTEPIQWQG